MFKKIIKKVKNRSFIKSLKKELEKNDYILKKYVIIKKLKIEKIKDGIVYLKLDSNEGNFNVFTFENEIDLNKIEYINKYYSKAFLIKPIESNIEIFKKYYYLSEININNSFSKKGKTIKNIKGDVDDIGLDTLINLGEI